jgi:hypothetical protein
MYELKDLTLDLIDKNLAQKLICKYHYSGTCGNLKFAFAFKYKGEIKNIVAYTSPIGRLVCQEVMNGGDASNTLELIRMISIDPKPKNLESYCIHKTFEYIKTHMPNYKIIISMADNSVGHHGYCYQASGFTYYGQSSKHKEHFIDGKRIHERTLFAQYQTTKESDLKKLLGDRYVCKQQELTKSRYYYIIAQNKKEKKEILKNIKVKSLPYPKGDNKRYNVFESNEFVNLDGSNSSIEDEIIKGQMTIFDVLESE